MSRLWLCNSHVLSRSGWASPFKQTFIPVHLPRVMSVRVFYFSSVCVYLCVSGCKLSIPGHSGCNLTGGLTLVNPLLGVLRMMMWAVDPPWWFHFLRASSRSQIEKLWGYYKVKGGLTLNMMTIPSWHFHFLKRLIPHSSWGQRCLLIFVQISFSLLVRQRIYTANMQCGLTWCTKNCPLGPHAL